MKNFTTSSAEIIAKQDKKSGVVSIYPKDCESYPDGTVILRSIEGGITFISVVRNNGPKTVPEGVKAYKTKIRKLLAKDYVIINGTLDKKLIKKLGVGEYVRELLGGKKK